ncbi:transglycosylase SLT domain-containing protein [Clostridium tarantellae]|uniref:Transglycosylase SLT domain-containing protein n=2 Tax=Clostridium tarantellae TaxID=39493 RepID=A0A6I1MLK5_9CLOT|nr:transglycosylase SLT domain-containing protein [Clostridium tarantellae]
MIFISIIGICYQSTKAISNNNGLITDIGTLGVPLEFVPYFNEASAQFNIPNWCLAAVAKQESNFNANTEYGGAYGIMQIQKIDILTGKDLWAYLINLGLGEEYKKAGYKFLNSEEMWEIFLNDPKAQILAGAYEIRYYTNYVLFHKEIVNKLNYNSNENMNLINWNSPKSNEEFSELLRRIFACYNGGPKYGMTVDLDNAQFDYPNKVFKYAIEFRDTGLIGEDIEESDNETVEKAINAGMQWVGKSPYVWGGGRTQEDVDAGRFDCSSFVHYAFSNAGIELGARENVVTFSLVKMGKEVPVEQMQRGDIIFFDTYTIDGHVAIYLGEDKFLHDGPSKGVWIDSLNEAYWKNNFNKKIRRVV